MRRHLPLRVGDPCVVGPCPNELKNFFAGIDPSLFSLLGKGHQSDPATSLYYTRRLFLESFHYHDVHNLGNAYLKR